MPVWVRTVPRGLGRAAEPVIPPWPAWPVATQEVGKQPPQDPVVSLPLALKPQLDPDLVTNHPEVNQAEPADEILAELGLEVL